MSRIASLGAIFCIVMGIAVHWGDFRNVRQKVDASRWVPITAIDLDATILGAFLWMKATSDMLVIWVALGGMGFIFVGERFFLRGVEDHPEDNAWTVSKPKTGVRLRGLTRFD